MSIIYGKVKCSGCPKSISKFSPSVAKITDTKSGKTTYKCNSCQEKFLPRYYDMDRTKDKKFAFNKGYCRWNNH